MIQCARTKRRRKDSEDDSNETDTDLPEVDLFQLQVNTLRRYKKHYKVSTRPGLNKAQLADVSNIDSNTIFPTISEIVMNVTNWNIFIAGINEALQNNTSHREGGFDIFHLYR